MALVSGLGASPARAVTIDWVTVGNPGNTADTTGFGAVVATYRISRTEVTNSQYTEFLNAVAAADPNALYDTKMSTSTHGGITQAGSSGTFTYSVKAGFTNIPVVFVTFLDALRFANWMHNGQPVGPQGTATTEDGAYTITSAGSTSAHCMGHAAELIQWGKQDIVFAGGAEEEHWTLVMYFDAMRATSSAFNDRPETASRPYDANRDGLVIAGGGGILVLEEMERAKNRGADIYGELAGYGANSDGDNMVAPSGEGAVRCMRLALESIENSIDYVNTHGTSTPAGDIVELEALRRTFGDALPFISSTKSMSGHSLGAAGVHEAIYSLLMMRDSFIAPSINIESLDEGAEDFPIVRETREASLTRVMSNSFGFGGANATLVFQKV